MTEQLTLPLFVMFEAATWHLTYIMVEEMVVRLDLLRILQTLKPYPPPTPAES